MSEGTFTDHDDTGTDGNTGGTPPPPPPAPQARSSSTQGVASNAEPVETQADLDAKAARDERVEEMAKAYEDADDPEAAARIRKRYTDET